MRQALLKCFLGRCIQGGALGAVYTGFRNITTAVCQRLFRVVDGNEYGNSETATFAVKNEDDSLSRLDNRVEGEGAYGKLEQVEIPELTERASPVAPVHIPSITPAAVAGE